MLNCDDLSEGFSIESFEIMNYIHLLEVDDTTEIVKADYYLVIGYRGTRMQNIAIDSFVCKNKASDANLYHTYFINIYRKTPKTNTEYTSEFPRDFYRYSMRNDHLFRYKWTYSGLSIKETYKGAFAYESEKFNCVVNEGD